VFFVTGPVQTRNRKRSANPFLSERRAQLDVKHTKSALLRTVGSPIAMLLGYEGMLVSYLNFTQGQDEDAKG